MDRLQVGIRSNLAGQLSSRKLLMTSQHCIAVACAELRTVVLALDTRSPEVFVRLKSQKWIMIYIIKWPRLPGS